MRRDSEYKSPLFALAILCIIAGFGGPLILEGVMGLVYPSASSQWSAVSGKGGDAGTPVRFQGTVTPAPNISGWHSGSPAIYVDGFLDPIGIMSSYFNAGDRVTVSGCYYYGDLFGHWGGVVGGCGGRFGNAGSADVGKVWWGYGCYPIGMGVLGVVLLLVFFVNRRRDSQVFKEL